MPSLESVNYTLALLTIGGILFGSWRGWWESPKRRSEREQNEAVASAILGERAVTDRNNTVITPGQPGLVHRVATVEEAVVEIKHVVALWTHTQETLAAHDERIKRLEDGRIEQLVTRAESAQMWRAVADNTIDPDPKRPDED